MLFFLTLVVVIQICVFYGNSLSWIIFIYGFFVYRLYFSNQYYTIDFFPTTRWKRVPPSTAIHDTLDILCLCLIKIQVHKILNICHQSAHICEFGQIGQKTDNKIEAYFFLRNCFLNCLKMKEKEKGSPQWFSE